jgi:hypothetical protein
MGAAALELPGAKTIRLRSLLVEEERYGGRTKRAEIGGKIIIGSSAVIDCTIRDLSRSGARLKVDGAFTLPEEFELRYGEPDVQRRSCRVVWKRAGDVGVVFG